jgi:hypothetical protein
MVGIAPTWHRIDRNRHVHALPGLADAIRQAQHPDPQAFIVLNAEPRPLAEDDDAVRRANAQLLLYQN